jgi:hypothetical protein
MKFALVIKLLFSSISEKTIIGVSVKNKLFNLLELDELAYESGSVSVEITSTDVPGLYSLLKFPIENCLEPFSS